MPTPIQRRILVAVSGMSPQIITETLYALCTAEQPWLPDEIHLLTTVEGRKNADLQLLHGDGHFYRLLRDYGIGHPIRFDDSTIHVIRSSLGNELVDLRTLQDNEAAADCICEKIRELTQDATTELHVSLAGGRKTMGFYAGYALSLFGRPQDRLSHVLVSEQYESLKDFFYPTPEKRVVFTREGTPLDAAEAQVWLAPIPFVRLRSFLSPEARINTARFSDVVKLVDLATKPISIEINLKEKTVGVGSTVCRLSPSLLAFYLWFAQRASNDRPGLPIPVDGEYREDYLKAYFSALHDIGGNESDAMEKGIGKAFFEQSISKLKRCLDRKLGPDITRCIGIVKTGPRGRSLYGIQLTPQQINIVE